ncbi:MAG: hypothetical protein JW839_07570 [Candidatus Lokiarchaeota archaeon]|nr:hypothetical protein [Candidatus Lokiarchaeota archaeon]
MQKNKFLDIGAGNNGVDPVEQLFDCLLGLTKPEISVLLRILKYPDECCQELARAEGKDRSVIQKILKCLFDKGWIEREEGERGRLTYRTLPAHRMREMLLRRIEETRLHMIDVVNRAFP